MTTSIQLPNLCGCAIHGSRKCWAIHGLPAQSTDPYFEQRNPCIVPIHGLHITYTVRNCNDNYFSLTLSCVFRHIDFVLSTTSDSVFLQIVSCQGMSVCTFSAVILSILYLHFPQSSIETYI